LLYLTNGDLFGGCKPVFTGPTIVDKINIDQLAEFASTGTR
jgi:simple sugar transport system substrate-binding protein